MFKTMAIALWVSFVTVGAFYVMNMPRSNENIGAAHITFENGNTGQIAVPIFNSGKVSGHFTTQVRYQITASTQQLFSSSVPHMINDALIEIISDIDPKKLEVLRKAEILTIGEDLARLLEERIPPLPLSNIQLKNTHLLMK